jgi:hypothetical protein
VGADRILLEIPFKEISVICVMRACNESSKGLRKRGVYQKKGAILGRVTLIADIRNKWLAGLALPVFAIGN